WFATACLCFASFQPIKIIITGSSERMVNYEQQCNVLKTGEFYSSLSGGAKKEAEKLFCKAT
ncbi:TPA: hypothetical protein ACSP2A_004237, partial [Aeromonas hydrophila]